MKKTFLSLILLCALCACSSSEDDMTYPEISGKDIVAVPTDCQVFKRGEVIPLNYVFTDDTELRSPHTQHLVCGMSDGCQEGTSEALGV